jgi:hypothetical protein
MATRPKRPQAKTSVSKTPPSKKPANKRVSAAKMDETVIREAVAKAPAPAPAAPAPAPVLVNAVKPEEKLSEPIEDAIESAVETLEKSFEAAMPVALAVNQKLVDIAQTNMNAGLDLARDLAAAKTPMEAMRLGMNYWHECFGVFGSQAQELRVLAGEFMTTANEPIRAQLRRS